MRKRFKVKDKNGKVLGVVNNFDPQRIARNFKPRSLAIVCFTLMATSLVSMVGETINEFDDIQDLNSNTSYVSYIDNDFNLKDSSNIKYNLNKDLILDDVQNELDYIDFCLTELEDKGYSQDECFIQACDKLNFVKEQMLHRDNYEYSRLFNIREVIRDVCEMCNDLLRRMNGQENSLINKIIPKNDKKRKGRYFIDDSVDPFEPEDIPKRAM